MLLYASVDRLFFNKALLKILRRFQPYQSIAQFPSASIELRENLRNNYIKKLY
tara:strand:- start:155 stop:313 length:159 start_codon:yes stop_codon:yes gene_type:complete